MRQNVDKITNGKHCNNAIFGMFIGKILLKENFDPGLVIGFILVDLEIYIVNRG